MRKSIVTALTVFVLLVGVGSATHAQTSVGTRAGYRLDRHIGAYIEASPVAVTTLSLEGSIEFPADDFRVASLGLINRWYPFDFGDLGIPGHPRDRRNFGHQFSPYFAGGVLAYFDIEDPIDSFESYMIIVPVEIGLRWYPFRTFVLSQRLIYDNIFVEVPLRYNWNLSDFLDLDGYSDDWDDQLSQVVFGFGVGYTF